MGKYQLSRPSIDEIVDYCNDLAANEELEVFEFGTNCDLVLHIYKDEDFDPNGKEPFNLVRIHTAQNGEWVDDTEDISVADDTLQEELNRINTYTNFGTI